MDYKTIGTKEEAKQYLGVSDIVAFDFETAPDDKWRNDTKAALDAHKSHIAGISLSVTEGSAVYIPLSHKVGKNARDPEGMVEFLRAAVFENPRMVKVAHNLAFEAMFLYALNIVVCKPCYDTIAAAQLTLKSRFEFRALADSGLKTLAAQLFCDRLPSFETVTAGRYFDELDPQEKETIRYACADSDYALRLYHKFNGWFDKYLPRHRFITEEVESPTSVYVGMMKYNGVPVDCDLMLKRRKEADEKISEIKKAIDSITGGVEIGANASTSAFRTYLYQDLRLPVLKTTEKNQEAADDAAMIMLKEWCEGHRPELTRLFELVQEYRKWGKLKSTYIDGYLRFVNQATGRIHPDLMPLGTATGRFAARNPNLQNCFDAKTEILTRRGFVAFPDLSEDDKVAQWENGDIYFVTPLEQIAHPYSGELMHLYNQHIDIMATPDHRCLLQNRKNNAYYVVSAENYSQYAKQIQAGEYAFGNRHLTRDEITILAATQADGNYHDGGIDFSFMKARKYRRLLRAVQTLGVPYSDHVKADGHVKIRLLKSKFTGKIMGLLGERKTWGPWVLDFDRRTVKAILSELPEWDGCFTRGNHYSTSIRENADWMQIVYSLTGIRAHLREYRNGNPNSKINYQLDITGRNYSLTDNITREKARYDGMVYCVSVPSGYIVIRRNGQVCVTGNCPRKGSDPIGIRNFIAAPPGNVLLSLDFSQIELRVGAFYCRDEKMLETYRTGGDIHAATTAVIYHIPQEEAADKTAPRYKERRTIAKNCNFGVFYGLFPKGLQHTLRFKAGLDTSFDRCKEIIGSLKAGYPGLTAWQEETKKTARETCYAQTWLGRRRYLPGILSNDWGRHSFAERCAMNTPIQGTAADILKLAMGRIAAGIKKRPWLKPLLQIHDELVFEIPSGRLEEALRFVKECMEEQPFSGFDVPIIAEASAGPRFGSLKEAGDA